ncbi:MAG: toxin-antitoxin system protein [Lachnospiraceae bacterium]|nr:toxin-antitoxin system protein [Lachnospiraceae bacterium]
MLTANFIYREYNITTFDGYILWIDCNKVEEGLKTTAWTDHVLNAMAIDNPLENARLYLNNEMQIFIDAEDSLDIWHKKCLESLIA